MKKGFTLIELLAVVIVLAIVGFIITPIVLKSINTANEGAFKSSAHGLISAANFAYAKEILNNEELNEVVYTYTDGVEDRSPGGKALDYKNSKPKNGTLIVSEEGEIAIAIHDGKFCALKAYKDTEVIVFESSLEDCKTPGETYVDSSGANAPVLTAGMIPVKWNETEWVLTTTSDSEWYDYDNKEWANAKTADDSFWVWIPRYAYSIVDTTPTYNAGVQTNFVQHPAFTFGEDEIEGFWVAKFEPSGTAANINIVPNATSLGSMQIGAQFDAAINMRSNNKYGWNASNVDTHMAKNSEWGAVAYLSKSIYGANEEVYKNNSNSVTGCAGNTVSSSSFVGCQNEYSTINGQKASTTHNIYGVYDMSGGAHEYTAAYVDNGHSNLAGRGQSILLANAKYKDVYEVGTTDTEANNYANTDDIFGDAIYETSSLGSGSNSWYGDYSLTPGSTFPWFMRGGYYSVNSVSGVFSFSRHGGYPNSNFAFRPIVISQ